MSAKWIARIDDVKRLRAALKKSLSCCGANRAVLIEARLNPARLRIVATNFAELSVCEVKAVNIEPGDEDEACVVFEPRLLFEVVSPNEERVEIAVEDGSLTMTAARGVRASVPVRSRNAFPRYECVFPASEQEWLGAVVHKGDAYDALYKLRQAKSVKVSFGAVNEQRIRLSPVPAPQRSTNPRSVGAREILPQLEGKEMFFNPRLLLGSLEYAKPDRSTGEVAWQFFATEEVNPIWMSRFVGHRNDGLAWFRVVAGMRW